MPEISVRKVPSRKNLSATVPYCGRERLSNKIAPSRFKSPCDFWMSSERKTFFEGSNAITKMSRARPSSTFLNDIFPSFMPVAETTSFSPYA